MSKACILLLAFTMGAIAPCAPLHLADWTHIAEIHVPDAPEQGVITVPLTAHVFDHAQPDLADLRVTTDTGEEVGYVLRVACEQRTTTALAPRMYNQSYLPGRHSRVTLDFGKRLMKNRLDIDASGVNFQRTVVIEASDDGRDWQVVRDDGLLFRAGEGGEVIYDKRDVTFPDNNQRYLRVTVKHGANDTGKITIRNIDVAQTATTQAETVPTPVARQTVAQQGTRTLITLDMKYRYLPLHQITLNVRDENFYRQVSIFGRNEEQQVISRPVEGGTDRRETVDASWTPISNAVIYRFTGGGAPEVSLTVNLDGAQYRYLRLDIDNGDNPPLRVTGAEATRLAHHLVFVPGGETYRLHLGNAQVTAPSYDIVHYIDRQYREDITEGTLGPVIANPMSRQDHPSPPWSERYMSLLWFALFAVCAILVVIVLRQLRAAQALNAPADDA